MWHIIPLHSLFWDWVWKGSIKLRCFLTASLFYLSPVVRKRLSTYFKQGGLLYSYRNLEITKSSSLNQARNSKFMPPEEQELGLSQETGYSFLCFCFTIIWSHLLSWPFSFCKVSTSSFTLFITDSFFSVPLISAFSWVGLRCGPTAVSRIFSSVFFFQYLWSIPYISLFFWE